MAQFRRRRQRISGSRTSKPVTQRWPETWAELNALPGSHRPSASDKPAVSPVTGEDRTRPFESPQLARQESALQSQERPQSSPYLSVEGGALKVTKPQTLQQKQTAPAFADPAILEAQKIQKARDAILTAPYLTVQGNVLTVTKPASELSAAAGLAGQTAPQKQQGPLRTITQYKDPEPAPGPPPDMGRTDSQPHIGMIDPALLEAQKTKEQRNQQSGNSTGGTPGSHSPSISGWTEYDVPHTEPNNSAKASDKRKRMVARPLFAMH